VPGVGRGEAELEEDVADVFVNGAFGDEEVARDVGVGQPLVPMSTVRPSPSYVVPFTSRWQQAHRADRPRTASIFSK
jgi:hypothetical protein